MRSKYRWYLKDPNLKFSNHLPPQPTLQDTFEELTGTHVTGIWLRKVADQWLVIMSWSNPDGSYFSDPEYGVLREDGTLMCRLPDDWAHMLVHGHSRYATFRIADFKAFYGTSGQ